MAKAKDIRFEDGDVFIDAEKGDFAITESDTQHVEDICESFAGWWKEFPTMGVGLTRRIASSSSYQLIVREIKLQLTADGYRIGTIQTSGNKLYITGQRKDENL